MPRPTLRLATLAVCLSLTLPPLAGCSAMFGSRKDPVRYYVLSPSPADGSASDVAPSTRLVVGLGPVTLPGYLDRKEIVTRVAPNRLDVSERDQWAEPLGENVKAVLARDLSTQLRGALVSIFPWKASLQPDFRVRIDFSRFEATSAGSADLVATWKLLAGNDVVAVRDSVLSRPVGADGSEATVAALGAALADLAGEIAGEIARQPRRGTAPRR